MIIDKILHSPIKLNSFYFTALKQALPLYLFVLSI